MRTRTIDTAVTRDGLLTMDPKYTHGRALTVRATESGILIQQCGFPVYTLSHPNALSDAFFTVGSMLGKW